MNTLRRLVLLSLAALVVVSALVAGGTSMRAQRKESVFVNLTSDQAERVAMALSMSRSLLDSGSDVTMFLNVDGVRVASTRADGLAAVRTQLAAFAKAGGRVIACPHCMGVRSVAAGDLVAGVTMGPEGAGQKAFLASSRSLSY